MTAKSQSLIRALSLGLAITLAACSQGPKPIAQLPAPPQATATTEIDAIIALLDKGDTKAAQKRISAALKRDPMNASVQVLRESVTQDPKQSLGPTNHAYTARAGDTMTGLAERFLGTRLKGYQLARYNGIAVPASLAAGQVLRIPGEPPRADPPRRAETRPAPTASAPPKPKPAAAKPVVARPAANPPAARQARAAGLAALNQGNVARAVGLLRRAAALDPGNPMITRDLGRAQRIAATVQSRK